MHKKLFIPGPTEVRKEVLKEMARPMIGHRTQEFTDLFAALKPKLQRLLYTQNDVLISSSSGSGLMEAAVRNCVGKKVLSCVCGAFSAKWADIAANCGKEIEKLEVAWGEAIKPEMIEEKLSQGGFDAIHLTHCETTTGVLSPLAEIAEVVKKYPDVLFLVDTVSSLGGIKVETDRLGIDICLASSQKALGLPPGLSVASVSLRAYERAKTITGRGYYFDLLELKKSYDKNQTPYTPSISLFYALNRQLDYILEKEGLEKRFARHKKMGRLTRKWAQEKGFELFPEKGFESDTITCLTNSRTIDLKRAKEEQKKKRYQFDAGYRELNAKLEKEGKPSTFRIAHLGDIKTSDLRKLLKELEALI
ncbi:MAG: alanine--glyoxylate aminotransferase family protein [Elusimicrobia bacterium]|nr:alanine--glyoxylate aminotransferase family protein [Elusimicrobiota bacterium]